MRIEWIADRLLRTTPEASRLPPVSARLNRSRLASIAPVIEPSATAALNSRSSTVIVPAIAAAVVPSSVTFRLWRSPVTWTLPVMEPLTRSVLRLPLTVRPRASADPLRAWAAPTLI